MNIHLPPPAWRLLNRSIEKKIERERPGLHNFLTADDHLDSRSVVATRLAIDQKYRILLEYLSNDPKRQFLINSNYLKYIRAALYLYRTSEIAVRAGILTAPSEIYGTINAVERCFDDLFAAFGLNPNGPSMKSPAGS